MATADRSSTTDAPRWREGGCGGCGGCDEIETPPAASSSNFVSASRAIAYACGAIRGHHDAIRVPPDAIRGHESRAIEYACGAIRGHHDAIRGHQDIISSPQWSLETLGTQSEVIMTQSESLRMQSEAISAPVPPVGPPRRRVVSQGGAVNGRGRGLHAGTTHPTRPGSHRARAQATLRPPARSRNN